MRVFILLALLLIALPAHAIKVMNLDVVSHVLIVNNGGEITQITLEPNRSYTTFGPMVDLRVKGGKAAIRADVFSDYAIWKGGKLFLQSRRD